MAGKATFKITVEGLETLAAKLRPEGLYGRPLASLLEDATTLALALATKRAPVRSGALAGSLRKELRGTVVDPYGVVSFAVANKGFRYGQALNASARYHYAASGGSVGTGGKRRSGGKSTKKWFTGIPGLVRGQLARLLKRADAEIEAQWAR